MAGILGFATVSGSGAQTWHGWHRTTRSLIGTRMSSLPSSEHTLPAMTSLTRSASTDRCMTCLALELELASRLDAAPACTPIESGSSAGPRSGSTSPPACFVAPSRLPVVQADVAQLPFADGSLAAVIAMMAHTDMPNYPSALQEVRRVLRPGGVFVHVGVHPCFCGGFADRSNVDAVVIRPGYLDGHWTTNSWTTQGLRDKVGAQHLPLPALLNAFVDAGLSLQEFTEGGATCPVTLAVKALKSIRHEP